jgi:hypothetical protein
MEPRIAAARDRRTDARDADITLIPFVWSATNGATKDRS